MAKSNLTNIRKRYFFRCNNISSHGFFSFFITKFCICFTWKEEMYVKVIEDDTCNRKKEFKAKVEIIKSKRNYEKVHKNIWRVLKCKEIATIRDFLYKYWFVQFGFWSLFSHIIRIWKLLVRSVGTYFSCKILCLQRETTLPFIKNKFLLSIRASLVAKTGVMKTCVTFSAK